MDGSNVVFKVVFVEATLKIVGLGWRPYISDHWNKFDFTVVVESCADLVNLSLGAEFPRAKLLARVFRLLRVACVLRLTKSIKSLRSLVLTLWTSLGGACCTPHPRAFDVLRHSASPMIHRHMLGEAVRRRPCPVQVRGLRTVVAESSSIWTRLLSVDGVCAILTSALCTKSSYVPFRATANRSYMQLSHFTPWCPCRRATILTRPSVWSQRRLLRYQEIGIVQTRCHQQ